MEEMESLHADRIRRDPSGQRDSAAPEPLSEAV